MFDVTMCKDSVRVSTVRKVLDSVSFGAGMPWLDMATTGDLPIRHTHRVFGLDGQLLVATVDTHILTALEASSRKAREFWISFVDDSYKDRIHKTQLFTLSEVMSQWTVFRKKVSPEALHVIRHVCAGPVDGTSNKDAS